MAVGTKKPSAQKAADSAVGRILPRVPDLVERMMELADGIRVFDESGEAVFTRPPDRLAIEYLLNRAFGKPAATVHTSAEVGMESRVVIVLPDNGRSSP